MIDFNCSIYVKNARELNVLINVTHYLIGFNINVNRVN